MKVQVWPQVKALAATTKEVLGSGCMMDLVFLSFLTVAMTAMIAHYTPAIVQHISIHFPVV